MQLNEVVHVLNDLYVRHTVVPTVPKKIWLTPSRDTIKERGFEWELVDNDGIIVDTWDSPEKMRQVLIDNGYTE